MPAIHRREVEAVVDVELSFRDLQHLGEEFGVRPALVQVVLAAAEVVEAGGDAALRRGAALADRILRERRVDAGVHVRVDHAGEGKQALAIVDSLCFFNRDIFFDKRELSAGDGDVALDDLANIGPDDPDVLDDEVVAHFFNRFSRWGSRPPSRTICMR